MPHNAGAQNHDGEEPQHHLVHDVSLWVGGGSGGLPVDRHTGVHVRGHSRNKQHGNSDAQNGDEETVLILRVVGSYRIERCVLFLRLGNVAGEGGAEKAGVQEGSYFIGFEVVVTGVTRLGDGVAEASGGLPHLVEHAEHVEQANEDGDLNEHGEAAHGHIDAVFFLQLGHFQGHSLPVVGVLFLDGLNLWLQFGHLLACSYLLHHGVKEDKANCYR